MQKERRSTMKKILIVDDESRIRRVYRLLLASCGYKTFEAANAIEAKEILLQEKIDLVLLDIYMPDVNGPELYEVMQLFHRDVKTIICSAFPVSTQSHLIKKATAYYDKTRSIEELFFLINDALNEELPKRESKVPQMAY
jgi:DNA-binding NtrC family response regulator